MLTLDCQENILGNLTVHQCLVLKCGGLSLSCNVEWNFIEFLTVRVADVFKAGLISGDDQFSDSEGFVSAGSNNVGNVFVHHPGSLHSGGQDVVLVLLQDAGGVDQGYRRGEDEREPREMS